MGNNEQNHIIKKINFNLELNNGNGLNTVRESVLENAKTDMKVRMLNLFNALNHLDEVVRIENLKIDLGNVTVANLADQFIEELEKSIIVESANIKDVVNSLQNFGSEAQTNQPHLDLASSKVGEDNMSTQRVDQNFKTAAVQRRLDGFIDFLKTGTTAWWNSLNSKESIIRFFEETLLNKKQKDFELLTRKFNAALSINENMRLRFCFLLNDAQLQQWFKIGQFTLTKTGRIDIVSSAEIITQILKLDKQISQKLIAVVSLENHLGIYNENATFVEKFKVVFAKFRQIAPVQYSTAKRQQIIRFYEGLITYNNDFFKELYSKSTSVKVDFIVSFLNVAGINNQIDLTTLQPIDLTLKFCKNQGWELTQNELSLINDSIKQISAIRDPKININQKGANKDKLIEKLSNKERANNDSNQKPIDNLNKQDDSTQKGAKDLKSVKTNTSTLSTENTSNSRLTDNKDDPTQKDSKRLKLNELDASALSIENTKNSKLSKRKRDSSNEKELDGASNTYLKSKGNQEKTQNDLSEKKESLQKQLNKIDAESKENPTLKKSDKDSSNGNHNAENKSDGSEYLNKKDEINTTEVTSEKDAEIAQSVADALLLKQLFGKKKEDKEIKEALPVNYAGIVLLWPMIKPVFEDRGYLNDKAEFKNSAAQFQALQLLNYIVSGTEELDESEMTLNKVLCNIPLETPVYNINKLTQSDKEEVTALYAHVINTWSVLKNTSQKGLRDSFIIRKGNLSETTEQWFLKVEQQGIDILIDKLPWGFKMIKLPWMPKILTVEW